MLILLAKSLACCLKLTILSCYTCWTIGSCSSQRSTKPYWSCSIINKTQVEVIESNDRQAKVRTFRLSVGFRRKLSFFGYNFRPKMTLKFYSFSKLKPKILAFWHLYTTALSIWSQIWNNFLKNRVSVWLQKHTTTKTPPETFPSLDYIYKCRECTLGLIVIKIPKTLGWWRSFDFLHRVPSLLYSPSQKSDSSYIESEHRVPQSGHSKN